MTEHAPAVDAVSAVDRSGDETATPPPAPLVPAVPLPPLATPLGMVVPPQPATGAAKANLSPEAIARLPNAQNEAIDLSFEEEPKLRDWWLQVPSWMASMVVHLALVLVLALVTTAQNISGLPGEFVVSAEHADAAGSSDELQSQMMEISEELQTAPSLSPPQLSDLPQAAPLSEIMAPLRAEMAKSDTDPKLIGGGTNLENVIGAGIGGGTGNSFELRLNGTSRAAMVASGGGTKHSEQAVTLALKWLSEHQNYDGSWTFQHQNSPKCHGSCGDPGHKDSKIAATAMALLPFLGNGHTHNEGPYKRQIELGLRFLVRSQRSDGGLNDDGGTMYGHGLASIVLCEAFGMTRDQSLRRPAQMAIDFIVEAQDPAGGGWRYYVQQPGDTSVVGWQLMALKSAQMAYLRVPQQTMRKAGYFLDSVQSDRGAVYGYQGPERGRPATTAIGLLGRMYLGWKHEQQPLQRGVQILSALGPSTDRTALKNNMYYNYYATQVMHHYGGYPWQRWNEVMREYLIKTQNHRGHETGSWYFDVVTDHFTAAGGRLYCTALAAMTLEVYYRYMPLYREDSTKGAFTRE